MTWFAWVRERKFFFFAWWASMALRIDFVYAYRSLATSFIINGEIILTIPLRIKVHCIPVMSIIRTHHNNDKRVADRFSEFLLYQIIVWGTLKVATTQHSLSMNSANCKYFHSTVFNSLSCSRRNGGKKGKYSRR